MNVKVESAGEWKKAISVEFTKEEVQKEFDAILASAKKSVDVQGFRKGKVPEKVIISRYGENLIIEVAEKLFADSFAKTLKDNDINPAGDPVFEESKINTKEIAPISFKAIVEIDPGIKIKDYKNLGIKVEK